MRLAPRYPTAGQPRRLARLGLANSAFWPGASVALDFTKNQGRIGLGYGSQDITSLSGWSFSRTGVEYEATSSGLLVPFASGVPADTDLGLQVWEARTNLLIQSQTLDSASWTKSNATVSADAGAAPDGTVTADKLVENTTSTVSHGTFRSATITATSTYTVSIFAKAAGRSQFLLWAEGDTSNGPAIAVDLSNGTITATGTTTGTAGGAYASSGIQPLANGWYRVWVTGTAKSDQTTVYCHPVLLSGAASSTSAPAQMTYTGDGSSGMYFWGAQLEQNSFAGPYIPTTSASATRGAASAGVGGVSVASAFTLMLETGGLSPNASSPRMFCLSDGTDNNRIDVLSVAGSNTILGVTSGGVSLGSITVATPAVAPKVALSWDGTAYHFAVNGTAGTNLTAALPPGLSTLRIGNLSSGIDRPWDGIIKRTVLYPGAGSTTGLSTP